MLFVLVVFYGLLLWFVLLFLFAWPDVCCCVFVIYIYICVWVRAALFWVESFRDANWILIVLEFTSQSPLRYFSRCMNTDNIHLYAIILLWKTQRLLQHYRRYRFNLFTQCCFWQGLSRASKCFCCASNCTGGMSTAATEEAEDLRLTYLFTVRSDRDVAFYCLWWNFWILFLQRCSASRNLRRIKLQGITGLYCPKASGPGAKSFGPRPGLSERVGDWIGGPRARSLRGAE